VSTEPTLNTRSNENEIEPSPPKRPKDPDWDDYWAHKVAEKAKTKVLAYFGIATVLLTFIGIKGIDEVKKTVQQKLEVEVAKKQKEASENIQKMLKDFEVQLEANKVEVTQRKEAFYREFVLPPQYRGASKEANGAVLDLSSQIGAIRDQGAEGTTVGFSVAYVMQAEIKAKLGKAVTISARGIYVLAKRYDEWPGEDYEGTSVTGALKALKEVGGYLESRWPYNHKTAPDKITDFKISGFSSIANGTQGIINELKRGKVVIAQITIADEFDKVLKDGRVVIKAHRQVLGGHSVVIVGFDPTRSEFRFANMWGTSWGDKGFGIIRDSDLTKILEGAYIIDGLIP